MSFRPRSSTLEGSPDPLSQPFARVLRIRRLLPRYPHRQSAPAAGASHLGNPRTLRSRFRSHPSSS
ncbi:hypothetical protein C0Z18_01100 [Trinickia dabaoshanensis]|uniref:Uncharacterized protein n=1 Tax=Trinickia dabaoshanensis TaxID=564714 RepID=A0A2N7W308_9BURK|nr:hypothetical protein C0Z18_01100 [Trinickia dabaoshanensis]